MSRTTAPLSDSACRSAKPTDRAYKLFDGDGLYLLVQPNGRKGWRFRYVKPDGREGLTSFGNYPVVGLADARKKRLEVKRMLAEGIDPIESKHQAKTQATIRGRTFESAALDWHKAMSAKWAPGHAKTVLSRLKTHVFPLIGDRAIVDLDTHDLMQPLEAIQKRGTIDVALRVQNYLQSIMREAKRARQIAANPASDLEGLIKAPRVIHRPALPLSRLPELQERIDTYRGRALTRLTVMLSLHVFVRSSELRFARWSEFDLKRGTWEIPDTRPALDGVPFSTRGTKMAGDIHLVPLSPQAVTLLEQIRTLTGEFDLVFAGDANPSKPMSENTVNSALRNMGYDTKTEICGHGFRSMACSTLIESGLWSETAIERQMSHKERNNVRAAYIHKAEFIEERRLIMHWWSRYLEANRQEHVTPHEFANQTGPNVTRLKAKRGATE
ncbi:integrase arm-type DNA-binding domain-containing protein [Pseudomonas rhodesiae]|uniref:tyrosine-type recombinase/integrase n=1 Tax=Pseudomonas rhodesiae TaxID=76760 RepID=UPI00156B4312|nr:MULTISPECIES: integrase arm-type DNA-binding domain-containing protein [Pseudomonas fluorescens group]QKJ71468.1 integrase arm-type DNA-binding domain-containing protein [Pseudomonas rhodesiae]USX00057.1 integrase arm-type DNA-binding domain-containing protein [Pseudomonas proteolytica]